jgi:hypothetical protein
VTADELSTDARELIEKIAASKRPVVFLFGAALSQPGTDGRGVPNVAQMVARLRDELGGRGGGRFEAAMAASDHALAYREGFRALLRVGAGQDAANRVIRRAVLEAHEPLDRQVETRVLADHPDQHRDACRALLDDPVGWHRLRPSVAALGRILASDHTRFGRVLTTNFDPLVEIAVLRADGNAHRTVLTRDGNPGQHHGQGTHVVYLHGYWFDADTLHSDVVLGKPRPQLEATLRRWLDRCLLVVLGYGGWDDVLMRSLSAVAADEGAVPDIAWGFYGEQDPAVVAKLESAGERVQLYEHIDLHALLPRLRERLELPEPPASGAEPASRTELEESASAAAGAPPAKDHESSSPWPIFVGLGRGRDGSSMRWVGAAIAVALASAAAVLAAPRLCSTTPPTTDPAVEDDDAVVLPAEGSGQQIAAVPSHGGADGSPEPCPEGMKLVLGGIFRDGRSQLHTINAFCMDSTEVTAAAYAACVEQDDCEAPPTTEECMPPDPVRYPALCVGWSSAIDHCEALGKRLPDEWEWEWAARGREENRPYPWGTRPPSCDLVVMLDERYPKPGCGNGGPSPVGSKPQGTSRDGLLDLAGNLWEWTLTKPTALAEVGTVRGGSWSHGEPERFSVSHRDTFIGERGRHLIGFRCIRPQPAR